jgi:hypothetical protein
LLPRRRGADISTLDKLTNQGTPQVFVAKRDIDISKSGWLDNLH